MRDKWVLTGIPVSNTHLTEESLRALIG